MSEALTAALAAIDQAAADPLARAKARGLMRGYDARWADANWVTVSVEHTFHLPIVNPATGRPSKKFAQAGKYDGTARYGNDLWLIEHKTTSQSIEAPDATYWRHLDIDAQVSNYMLAHWQSGEKLAGTLYDVIRKPTIGPILISKAVRASVVADRHYFGTKLPHELLMELAAGTHERETPEMFEARLANDAIAVRPEWYYGRKCISRLDHEIVEYAQEKWDVAREIADATKRSAWYRNSGACMTYGTPCEYLGICSGHDSPDSDRWVKRSAAHRELPVLGNTFAVSTDTSVTSFPAVPREKILRYELGIERVDREESDALTFGSLLHAGLEGWWKSFMETDNVNDCASAPVCHAGTPQSVSETPVAC